ncbi:hypothetical protein BN8_06667 [Fibrisoma limi BUZ 3]|uniref:Phosphate-selective porin O and P n=1 Tax=Fibrisoma limi BUZ 3 TaxID=1185876 RepID=I2GTN0_9BACT|nr:hypothetical protein [Fibrisoma limi]CCH57260.1 hypothetical protein BN8_06667 [Fibrisoma limi BUZ 3]
MKNILFAAALLGGMSAAAQQPTRSQAPADTLAPPAEQTQRPPGTATRPSAIVGTAGADKNELKYNLNESGSHFFKVTFLNQTWLRLNQSNPGTTVNQVPKENTFDIGLRRTRIQMFGQLTDHVFLYVQFGMNNFNFLNAFPSYNNNGTPANRKIAAFFHDAVGEYLVFKNKDYLKLGAGLTIVNGLSRFSQPSVSSIMSMDVPVFAQATVDQTDEFSRKLSLYARGQVGPIDYRVAVSDPFPVQTNGATPAPLSSFSNFAQKGHTKQFQGLFLYQFFDKEANQTPGYMTGTYLGKKKIFNLEGGFITQKAAMWHREATADTVYTDLNLWSLAAFLDMPLNRQTGSAINAYVGYFNLNYGPNYLRFNGIMNPASGTTASLPGASGTQGNAFPMFGTGKVVYAQVGYLLRQDLFGAGKGTLMPYAQMQMADYQRLTKGMSVFNVGLNYLINGHNGKLTLDYQNRPIYEAAGTQLAPTGRRGQFVVQYQVFI